MRVLHAIHDFLPVHRSGSEIYAYNLCRQLSARHEVSVLCAELDPRRRHGSRTLRTHDGLDVHEIVNNWQFRSLEETYASPELTRSLSAVLREVRPDVLHVHSLLNLSFELPALARAEGIPTVATLHDYTLFCASGGQRVHAGEQHVCTEIDTDRCARCFTESPFFRQMQVAGVSSVPGPPALRHLVARALGRRSAPVAPVVREDVDRRLAAVARAADAVEVFVSPSRSVADESARLGIPREKIRVSDYGFPRLDAAPRRPSEKLRIGFIGTLAWHKGAHMLLQAARSLPADRFEVLIYGNLDWFPSYVSQLRRMAERLPVRFMGGFGPAGTAEAYGAIDVLVVPSLWPENSPLVIHEAYQSGVPVVGADVGGVPELVRHEENGLVYAAPSAQALAAALTRVIETPGLLARFASNLPQVKRIEDDAAEWERLYSEVLARRSARRPA